MPHQAYKEKLEWFKQNEKPEVILFIADSPELTRIVVAWTNTCVEQEENPPEPDGDSENAVWDWLWKNVSFSKEELFTKSSVPSHRFDERVDTLIGNRIICPDGTVNSFVQRYLREKVLGLFGARPKRSTKARRTA
jgi:hypothetical protein